MRETLCFMAGRLCRGHRPVLDVPDARLAWSMLPLPRLTTRPGCARRRPAGRGWARRGRGRPRADPDRRSGDGRPSPRRQRRLVRHLQVHELRLRARGGLDEEPAAVSVLPQRPVQDPQRRRLGAGPLPRPVARADRGAAATGPPRPRTRPREMVISVTARRLRASELRVRFRAGVSHHCFDRPLRPVTGSRSCRRTRSSRPPCRPRRARTPSSTRSPTRCGWGAARGRGPGRGAGGGGGVGGVGHLGLLVLDGFIARHVRVIDRPPAELIGPGDLLHPWERDHTEPFPAETRYEVLEPARLAVLDRRFAAVAGRWPELVAALFGRAIARSRTMVLYLAISQLVGVEMRLLVLLWHIADRWCERGENGVRDGCVIPVHLTHQLLASLISAQRPTVTSALAQLTERGLISRSDDGRFVMHGAPPTEFRSLRSAVR